MEDGKDKSSGGWIEVGMTVLAIVGLLTIVIGGSILIQNVLEEDERTERVERRVIIEEREVDDRECYEERRVVGLFGDRDDSDDDFDAEAEFADDRRTVIICEDW